VIEILEFGRSRNDERGEAWGGEKKGGGKKLRNANAGDTEKSKGGQAIGYGSVPQGAKSGRGRTSNELGKG